MTDEAEIPIPVRFNAFKHHRNYILSVLQSATPEIIVHLLDPVCNNYIDIYTGRLSPEAISQTVIEILKSNHVFMEADFIQWAESKTGYRQIQLEDHSEWIVRRRQETDRYIHLHPSRGGKYTIRFKGSTLKTVYLLKSKISEYSEEVSLKKVNQIRMQIGLSPVKKLDRNKGILKCYKEFFSQE